MNRPITFRFYKSRALALLVIAIAIISICLIIFTNLNSIVDYYCKQDGIMARLNAGNSRIIVITGKSCWEINRPYYYQIEDKGTVVSPKFRLDYDDGKHRSFSLVYAEDKNLIGVLDTTSSPSATIIIFDFRSGDSWPLQQNVPLDYDMKEKWRVIFGRLQKENPQLLLPPELK